MITAAKLRIRTVKDLAAMAKKKSVLGWHSMRKDELVTGKTIELTVPSVLQTSAGRMIFGRLGTDDGPGDRRSDRRAARRGRTG